MQGDGLVLAQHDELGAFSIQFEAPDRLLFCENETDFARLFGFGPAQGPFKDAFHEYLVHGRTDALSAIGEGTKAAGLYLRTVPPDGSITVRLRLRASGQHTDALIGFDEIFTQRIAEADAFYAALQKDIADEDMRRI